MNALSRFLLLFIVAGTFVRSPAADFARKVPADSLLFLELKDVPGYQKRLADIPAFQSLKDFNWKQLILQLYQVGLNNSEDPGFDEEAPSMEELDLLLTESMDKWQEINRHLKGDIAFSIGNFQDTVSVFTSNAKIRKSFALADFDGSEEELSEEELAVIEKQLEQEEQLDDLEAAAILSQFHIWVDVKEGEELESKLLAWLAESFIEDPDAENNTLLGSQEWEGATLHSFGTSGVSERVAIHWAIKKDVWLIAFTEDSLKKSLNQLTTPSEDVLANQQVFQESIDFVGPSDYLIYFDFSSMSRFLEDVMAEIPTGDNQAMPQVDAIMDWLALDAFLPYVIGAKLEGDGISSRGRYGFKRETALSRIFMDPDAGEAEIPAFLHKDVHQFAAFNWHLGNGWSRLETELTGLVPQAAAGLGLARMLASGQAGFDIKLQFLDHLEGNTFFIQAIDAEVIEQMLTAASAGDPAESMKVQMEHPTGGQNYLFGFKMKTQAPIEEAMNRLLARLHPGGIPEPIRFEEHDIFYPIPTSVQGESFSQFLSYTFLDHYLLLAIGDDSLIKNSIKASSDPDLQLFNDTDFKRLREKVLPNAIAIEYASGEQQENAVKMMQSSLAMLQSEDIVLPDLMPLAKWIDQSINTAVRKGFVYEIEGLVEFSPAE